MYNRPLIFRIKPHQPVKRPAKLRNRIAVPPNLRTERREDLGREGADREPGERGDLGPQRRYLPAQRVPQRVAALREASRLAQLEALQQRQVFGGRAALRAVGLDLGEGAGEAGAAVEDHPRQHDDDAAVHAVEAVHQHGRAVVFLVKALEIRGCAQH